MGSNNMIDYQQVAQLEPEKEPIFNKVNRRFKPHKGYNSKV